MEVSSVVENRVLIMVEILVSEVVLNLAAVVVETWMLMTNVTDPG
jgi:hypothetical protein